MDSGYPKSISDGFQGIPNSIDAAFVWSGNGKIYFFKGMHHFANICFEIVKNNATYIKFAGDQFYRFDPAAKPPVKSNYPKSVSNWAGVPESLDAALQYTNGYTYFFKAGQYYRFNDRTFAVSLIFLIIA